MAASPGQDSVRPSTPNLASAFKRGAGLQGLSLAQSAAAPEAIDLTTTGVIEQATVHPEPTDPEPSTPDPTPVTRPGQQRRTSSSRASASRNQPRRRSSQAATERSVPDPAAREQTAIWVEISLRNRLKAHRAATNMDATNAVLAALRAADRDALRSIFGHNISSGDADDPFAPIPATRVQHSDATTQITLRPTARALAAIDELAKEVGAPNRSALIAAVLHAYLPD
jgi:hypothetical protein